MLSLFACGFSGSPETPGPFGSASRPAQPSPRLGRNQGLWGRSESENRICDPTDNSFYSMASAYRVAREANSHVYVMREVSLYKLKFQ